MSHLLSLSNTDTDYYRDQEKKFDHVSCRFNGTRCKSALSAINHNYNQFNQYRRIKDYSHSINELKSAFSIISEIDKPGCKNCAEYFRSTVTESLEDVRDELKRMSTGIFRTKRYTSSFIEAENTLMEFENAVQINTIQINNQEENTFKSYRQKNVV